VAVIVSTAGFLGIHSDNAGAQFAPFGFLVNGLQPTVTMACSVSGSSSVSAFSGSYSCSPEANNSSFTVKCFSRKITGMSLTYGGSAGGGSCGGSSACSAQTSACIGAHSCTVTVSVATCGGDPASGCPKGMAGTFTCG
jgi:hypothetical protein